MIYALCLVAVLSAIILVDHVASKKAARALSDRELSENCYWDIANRNLNTASLKEAARRKSTQMGAD